MPALPELPVLRSLAEVDGALKAETPILMLAWHDKSPRRDAEIALQEAVNKHGSRLAAYLIDARDNAPLVERLKLGKNAALFGFFGGKELVRRNRPWNTDVTGIADEIFTMVPEDALPEIEEDDTSAAALDAPVAVTAATFKAEVIDSPVPVIVDFWADWCQPCKMVAPILDKLAKEFAGQIKIAKVDVDAEQELAGQFGIQSIPTLMFVKSGQIVGQSPGAPPEDALRDVANQLITLEVPQQ